MEILEVTLAGTGNLSGFEDSHEVVQGFKCHGIAQVEAPDGQGECEVGLAHTGRAEEADIKGLLYPGHIGASAPWKRCTGSRDRKSVV